MRTVSKPLNRCRELFAADQGAIDAVQWALTATPTISKRELTAFDAGHRAGWRDCRAWLSLHGHLTLDDAD